MEVRARSVALNEKKAIIVWGNFSSTRKGISVWLSSFLICWLVIEILPLLFHFNNQRLFFFWMTNNVLTSLMGNEVVTCRNFLSYLYLKVESWERVFIVWQKREKSHSLGRHENNDVMVERLTTDFVKLSKIDLKKGYLSRSLYR